MTIGSTYVLRHGRTALSATYRINGNPAQPIDLDEVGIEQCARVRGSRWLDTIAICLTSTFRRAQQTADILIGDRDVARVVEPHLDEIDYGAFEGGPWLNYGAWLRTNGPAALPPGAGESWYAAVDRLLAGLAACLKHPGPRLVVGHGLLVSLLRALTDTDRPWECSTLPEAPYVEPIVLTDEVLAELIDRGRGGPP